MEFVVLTMVLTMKNDGWFVNLGYPLVQTNKKLLKTTIEIVDFPIKNGGSFHSFLYVHQRVIIPHVMGTTNQMPIAIRSGEFVARSVWQTFW